MSSNLVSSEAIDRLLQWPLGKAARLARRQKLPHYILPDGSLRFSIAEVQSLIQFVPASDQGDRPSLRILQVNPTNVPNREGQR